RHQRAESDPARARGPRRCAATGEREPGTGRPDPACGGGAPTRRDPDRPARYARARCLCRPRLARRPRAHEPGSRPGGRHCAGWRPASPHRRRIGRAAPERHRAVRCSHLPTLTGMLLTLDIGNTEITAGLFQGDTLSAHWRMTTLPDRTPDEWAGAIGTFLVNRGHSPNEVRAACHA